MVSVLLIEDNIENAAMTIRILESEGYEVVHCLRGMEGRPRCLSALRADGRLVLLEFQG